jgi:hypothetical protein
MGVGDNCEVPAPAKPPELGEGVPVQHTYSAGIGLRVEIVIVSRFPDLTAIAIADA